MGTKTADQNTRKILLLLAYIVIILLLIYQGEFSMKKIAVLSLLSLSLLASCGETSSTSATTDLNTDDTADITTPSDNTPPSYELTQSMLDSLSEGYSLENLVTEEINGVKRYFYSDSFYKNDKYTLKVYETKNSDPDKSNNVVFETYSADEEGYLVSERRNLNNERSYAQIYNPVLQEYSKFADNYTDFFSLLELSDFTKEDDTYTLKSEAVDRVSPYLLTQLYGNPGFELASFTITVGEEITYKAIAEPYKTISTTYNYTFDGTVVDSGADIEVEERADPYPNVEDAEFADKIASLKEHNYVLTQTDYENDEVVSTSTFISAGDLTYRENTFDGEDLKIAAYKDGDAYYEADRNGEDLILSREITEEEFNALFPSFNISRACFDKSGDNYVIKDDISDDTSVFTTFMTSTDQIGDLTISMTDDKITFTNVIDEYKTVVEFASIGTADVGYTLDDIKESSASEWAELMDESSYAHLQTVLLDEINNFPVPTDFTMLEAWVDFSEEDGLSILAYLSSTPTVDEAMLNSYGEQLTAAGYQLTDGDAEYGGSLYSKETDTLSIMVEVASVSGADLGADDIDYPILALIIMAEQK